MLRGSIRVIIELFCSRKFDWFALYLTIYVIVFSFEALTNATYIGTSVTEFCIQDDPEDQPIEASASEEIEFMEQEMSANEAEAEDYYDEEDEITDRVELEMVPHNDLF